MTVEDLKLNIDLKSFDFDVVLTIPYNVFSCKNEKFR